MDPETARTWAPVVAAFVGGFLGAMSAIGVAIANARNQRGMADDAARRQWRAELVRPLLDIITKRASLYIQISKALARRQNDEASHLVDELAATPDTNVFAAPLRNRASTAMRSALAELYAAENETHDLIIRRGAMGPEDIPRALQAGENLSRAMAAIHDAAEELVLGPLPGKKHWPRLPWRRA